MHDQDLTTGHIPSQLWKLAWPMMLSMFFYTLYNLVDTYWVSKISSEAIAAVSISQITLFAMISLGFGITAGSGVIMAMHIGAKDKPDAERVLGQSFVLSAMMAALFTAIAFIFKEEFLTLSGAHGAIYAPAEEYFEVVSAGSVLLFLMMSVMFAFNSQGDTATLTKLFALSTIVNIGLDPLLIFGYWGLPELGITGAAIATLISQFIFLFVAIISLSRDTRSIRFHFRNLTFKWHSVKRVLRIGFPAALTQVIFPIGLAALTYVTALSFHEPGAIAFSLGFRMEFFAYLPAAGFGFGAMALMGQSMGAKNYARAKTAFNKSVRYAFLSGTGLGLAGALFSGPIISVFTNDPLETDYASSFMYTAALSFGFLSALLVQANAFQSIDKSWPGFWIFLLRIAVIAVPLSYILTVVMGFGIESIWIAVILGNVIAATTGFFWFRKSIKRVEARAEVEPSTTSVEVER